MPHYWCSVCDKRIKEGDSFVGVVILKHDATPDVKEVLTKTVASYLEMPLEVTEVMILEMNKPGAIEEVKRCGVGKFFDPRQLDNGYLRLSEIPEDAAEWITRQAL
jgi:hypothetical protein